MNKWPSWTLLVHFVLACQLVTAQISVSVDKPTATYQIGETIRFKISSTRGGVVNYTLMYDDYAPLVRTGTVNTTAGQPVNVTFVATEPGSIRCDVTQGTDFFRTGAVVDPFKIPVYESEPADFDAFWQRQKTRLAQIPIDPKIKPYKVNDYSTTYEVNLASIENRRVYGYLTVPNATGPFPGVIVLPSFGNTPGLVQPDVAAAEFGGAISLAISIMNTPPDQTDPKGFNPDIGTNPDSIFYKYALMAAVRGIDYLFTRPDFDKKNLCALGVSQGGGLALLTAGLDKRVTLLAASNPSHCQHTGLRYNKPSGFPYYIYFSKLAHGTAEHEKATASAVKYYEGAFFARRFTGPVLFSISYKDDVNAPSTTFAAYNQFRGPVFLVHHREGGHYDNPEEFWLGRFDFFRRYLPGAERAPWPWKEATTGYMISAGEDLTGKTGLNIQLNGQIEYNTIKQPLTEVQWELVSGPGRASFTNPNGYTTKVSFTHPGEYWIRFSGADLSPLQNKFRYYTLSDFVKVTVTGTITDVETIEEPGFQLGPNPVNDQLHVYWKDIHFQQAEVKVVDILGRIYWKGRIFPQVGGSAIEIDTNGWSEGTYFIQAYIKEKNAVILRRFVKISP